MSHLRGAASWYWPGVTRWQDLFAKRDVRPSRDSQPAEQADSRTVASDIRGHTWQVDTHRFARH